MRTSLQLFAVLSLSIIILSMSIRSLDASGTADLRLDYYASSCPSVLGIVRKEMECAVLSDPRNAAFILRLHFHDCFVQVIFFLVHYCYWKLVVLVCFYER